MTKTLSILLSLTALLVFGCSGEDLGTTDIPTPVWDIDRYDGSSADDGIFKSEEDHDAFCAYNPDSQWCSEVGTSEQAWVSHMNHGVEQAGPANGTCYGPSSAGARHCLFPEKKQFRLILDSSNCVGAAASDQSLFQIQAVIDGVMEGLLVWNDQATDVKVTTSNVAGYMPVNVRCVDTGTAELASGGWEGNAHTQIADLPVAPNGKDQKKAIQNNTGKIDINMKGAWAHVKGSCGASPTVAKIKDHMRRAGTHELGHTFGFNHFNSLAASNIMYPFAPNACQPTWSIHQSFLNALSDYNGSAGGGVTIKAGGLSANNPL